MTIGIASGITQATSGDIAIGVGLGSPHLSRPTGYDGMSQIVVNTIP